MNSYNLSFLFTKVNISHVQYIFNTRVHPCVGVILFREFNTHSSQRKGKLSAVRKKINHQEQTYEDLETKSAASVIKKFNYENKHMFGELMNVVKKTCKTLQQTTKTFSFIKAGRKKKSSATTGVISSQDLTYNNYCIPIQDVKPSLQSLEIPGEDSVESTTSISDSILKFPLMDKVAKEQAEEIANEFNCLRQWLEKTSEEKMPSVTSILERTMPPEQAKVLERWKASMIMELGVKGFEKYQQELFFNGSSLHQSINGYLSKIPEMKAEVLPTNAGHWTSLKSVLPHVKEVKLLEEHIVHPFLHYKGVVDCLGKYKNHLVVVDWKTSKKPKLSLSSTYDNPLQIAAYVGALNFDPKFKYMVNQGLIVIAYENGTPATAHYMNESVLLNYWGKWLCRLKLYYDRMQCN